MSVTPTPAPPPPDPTPPPPLKREIRIISHSSLFYWWPVWAVGFLVSIITFFSGQRLAVVPNHTVAAQMRKVQVVDSDNNITMTERDVLIVPEGKHLLVEPDNNKKAIQPYLHISSNRNLGVLFCTVLLLVIVITNVPLRGLWSVIVIIFIVFATILFAVLDWWGPIIDALTLLDIRINMYGYLFISTVLFIIWLVVFLFFDKQIYMVFTPGQFRVRLEIGDAETAYDTTGMTLQKQRSDLFRHWILGLGSGDLIVRTSGAQAHQFDIPNVLFLGRRVHEIENLLRSRAVFTGGPT